jgi:predicted transcriptional regulator
MTSEQNRKRLKVVGIRLDDEMYKELKRLADAEHRKFSSFLVVALRRYLDSVKSEKK